ncbi:UDP-glucosyl transferase 85A3 [Hibiscus trionum]|uniref:UDP-glucosyl transferase 85A3 n=1 Tax=Hibiscus trionum TaxID=183268 RepID=A0A9W7JAX1_HIBTR|nr:UDP-glucosyl transferase 85A3 [Hibiscus trionum]
MHAVCLPYPAQGHINPMLNLAKLLHHKGFRITFVNTEYNHKRLLRSRGLDSLSELPDFCFETIPDGLPPSDDNNVTQDIFSLFNSLSTNGLEPFRHLLRKLNGGSVSPLNSDVAPRVTCIITDDQLAFPMEAAEELGVPCVTLWTASTVSLVCYAHIPRLFEQGFTPVTGAEGLTKEYLDTVIEWMPGMKDVRFKDFPSYVRTTDPNDGMLNFILKEMASGFKSSAILLNTFESLEQCALATILSVVGTIPVYTVGPLHLLVDRIKDDRLKHMDSNLWTEQSECLEWLDSREPESVMYVNFGSIAVISPQQLIEFAWGLANSKQSFLWIIRPDLVEGKGAILPTEFVTETQGRGLLASWCRQDEVLRHPSVGGFLSHMGWNSMIESVSAGVPMLCLPNFGDQQTNTWLACTELGIGMEIDEDIKRDQVEMLVRELMEGEKGIEMKAKAIELKEKAKEASGPGGSSFRNLNKLLTNVLCT